MESASVLLKMRFLKKIKPVVPLSAEFLRQLAEEITEITLPAESILFEQGDAGDACYLIESGHIQISAVDKSGKPKIVADLRSPSLFGETALLLDTPRNATAYIAEEVKLLIVSKSLFAKMMEKEKDAARAINLLHQARSRPIQANDVDIFQHTTADGEVIMTLRHIAKNHYFQLSSHGFLSGHCWMARVT